MVATTAAAAAVLALVGRHVFTATTCALPATHSNELRNPNYKPGSPRRSVIGKGYVLSGIVRSSATCRAISHVKIEFFQTGPNGRYSNGVTSWDWRGTVFTRPDGSYRFEGPFPGKYGSNDPHIHLHISAPGFRPLNTTYFPRPGASSGDFPLVLVP